MEKRILSRRDFLRAASLVAGGSVLAACASPSPATPQVIEKEVTKEVQVQVPVEVTKVVEKEVTPTTPPARETKTVRFYEQGGHWQGWVEQLAFPMFYDKYPWIKIDFEPIDWDGFADKTLTQMAAGTAPDVLHGWSDIFQKWVSKKQLLDLNPLVETDFTQADKDDQIAFQWNTLVDPFTKERFAIPGYVDSQILYYNKDAFDEKKVAYPTKDWNFTDYAEASKKLNYFENGKQTRWGGWYWYGSWTFNSNLLNAFGGHFRDADTWLTCEINSPESKAAIEWVRARIWDDKSWVNDTQTAALGISGDSGQLFATGTFNIMQADIEFWPSMANEVKFKWDIMHLPSGPAGRHALGDNDAWCMYKGTLARGGQDTVNACWQWMKFMNGPDFQKLIAFNEGDVPARKSVNKQWPTIMRSQFPSLAPVTLEVITEAFDMGHLTPSEQFRYQADAQPIVEAALQQIWQTGTAKVDILDQVAKDVNKAEQDAFHKENG